MASTLALLGALALAGCGSEGGTRPILFVAASFQDAAAAVIRGADPAVRLHVGASSTLARQIAMGARTDGFVSAHRDWIDDLERKGLLAPDGRRPLVRNELVVVVPRGQPAPGPDARIAIGDPDHVPAGVYARQAMQARGTWEQVAPRLIRTHDVRAALALCARREVDAAIVYATDARGSPRVEVVVDDDGLLGAAPEIVYEFALLRGGDPGLFETLLGATARQQYERLGFKVIAE